MLKVCLTKFLKWCGFQSVLQLLDIREVKSILIVLKSPALLPDQIVFRLAYFIKITLQCKFYGALLLSLHQIYRYGA